MARFAERWRGFSVWSQNAHQPQRDSLIPAALSSRWRAKPRHPPTLLHPRGLPLPSHPCFYFLIHLFLISFTPCLLTLPHSCSFFLTFNSCAHPFPNVWCGWHLARSNSYLQSARADVIPSLFVICRRHIWVGEHRCFLWLYGANSMPKVLFKRRWCFCHRISTFTFSLAPRGVESIALFCVCVNSPALHMIKIGLISCEIEWCEQCVSVILNIFSWLKRQ